MFKYLTVANILQYALSHHWRAALSFYMQILLLLILLVRIYFLCCLLWCFLQQYVIVKTESEGTFLEKVVLSYIFIQKCARLKVGWTEYTVYGGCFEAASQAHFTHLQNSLKTG